VTTVARIERPVGVTILAVLYFVGAAFLVLGALGLAVFMVAGGSLGAAQGNAAASVAIGAVGAAFCLMLAAVDFAAGYGLWTLKPWGRTVAIVLAVLGLLGFPFGTLISIVVLVYMFRPGTKVTFSGKSIGELTAQEAALVAAPSSGMGTGVVIAIVAVVAVIALVGLTGIVAAIAVPGLLRARMSGNEASAIGALRAINSAQAVYATQCNGYAPTLRQLADARVLSPDLGGDASVTKSGYRIALTAATGAQTKAAAATGCGTTVTGYFAHAEPMTMGATGTRAFATDSRGTIFQDTSGPVTESAVAAGAARPID